MKKKQREQIKAAAVKAEQARQLATKQIVGAANMLRTMVNRGCSVEVNFGNDSIIITHPAILETMKIGQSPIVKPGGGKILKPGE